MRISIEQVTGEDSAIVVLSKTGIKYTAQCAGIACSHPEAEGYVIDMGRYEFDSCSYICGSNNHRVKEMAEAFDKDRKKAEQGYHPDALRISFDYDRINEAQEGWIPVILNGLIDHWNFEDNVPFFNAKGWFHDGNCD